MLYTLISMNETMSLVQYSLNSYYKLGKKIFVRIINFIIIIYSVKKMYE